MTILSMQLKRRRIALRLTRTEWAAKLGVRWDYVWRWEEGRSQPNAERLEQIMLLLDRLENER